MEHREAVERGLAERYVLGDLSDPEREAFEEHFFDCPECAREVRLCAEVLANVRALVRERESGPRGWMVRVLHSPALARAAIAASVVLLALTFYLGRVRLPALERQLAELRAPQPYAAYFVRPVVRGEEQKLTLPAGARFLGLAADLPPGAAYSAYHCELRDDGGRTVASVVVPAPPDPAAPVHLLAPRSALRSGRYTLIVSGADPGRAPVELARFHFTLDIKPESR